MRNLCRRVMSSTGKAWPPALLGTCRSFRGSDCGVGTAEHNGGCPTTLLAQQRLRHPPGVRLGRYAVRPRPRAKNAFGNYAWSRTFLISLSVDGD